MSRKNWGALGCAAFVGVAVAFPVGVIFGGRYAIRQEDGSETQRYNASGNANFRKFYSPQIYNDPYVEERWRKGVEALEAQCRHSGERCTESKAARRWLSEKR